MQAVIMAAGEGTRMRPLTYKTPKVMLPVKGKPILEHILNFLPDEISEVILVVNYLSDQIENYFKGEFGGRKITYVRQEELNGTGGAVHACKKYLKGRFLVLNGDDLHWKPDLEKLCQEELGALAFEVEDPSKYGVLMTDSNGNLTGSIEKPETSEYNLIATGAYVLNQKFFDYELVPIVKQEFGLPQTLAVMAKDYPVKVLKANLWMPVGNPEDLEKAQTEIEKFLTGA